MAHHHQASVLLPFAPKPEVIAQSLTFTHQHHSQCNHHDKQFSSIWRVTLLILLDLSSQAKVIQALWLYLPPYINSTADITITSVTSTASSRRRRLQATAGSADVTTELDVGSAYSVAATSTAVSSIVTGSKFLVGRTASLHELTVSSKGFLLCNA